jgi:Ca-activated chloride channel homolog
VRHTSIFVVVCVLGLVAVAVAAAPTPGGTRCLDQLGDTVGMAEVGEGSLLYRTAEPGRYIPAPHLATEAHIVVRGILARTRVTQHFSNPTDEWLEGVYVFPLPAGAAVDTLRMVVGDRIIEGQIQERAAARRVYEQARTEGRTASLVEQERPNIFTTSVANIAPGEEIQVTIEYGETLRLSGGELELRFPMVVGPRYIPGVPTGPAQLGWSDDTDQVPDASRITPPVREPGDPGVNRVQLTVDLDLGVPLQALLCPYHPVSIAHENGRRYTVALAKADVPADRDFVLRMVPQATHEPTAVAFTEEEDGARYVLVMLMPPNGGSEPRLPRETIFVIDTSGSMYGASIQQARRALLFALGRLHPEDSFNVIQFNSTMHRLFDAARPAMPAALEQARAWVGALQANGGTEMLSALRAALAGTARGDEAATVRQVVFITDGCVGNEDQLFEVIRRELGRSRLFTVGIGSAPNSHFMERAARFGRGTFSYIGSPSEVEERMQALFTKLEAPVLSDIEVRWNDPAAEAWPQRIPDLYAGDPVVVAARLASDSGEVVVTGRRGVEPLEMRMPIEVAEERAGIARLWARRKIASLTDQRSNGVPEDQVRAAVLEVALAHHLLSKYTSLVAVDVTPRRPSADELHTAAVPTELPAGWSRRHVFGSLPKTATRAPLSLVLGLLLLLAGAVLLWVAEVR